ncbi:hypothetical protein AB9K21_05380 [Anaplasma phagocytophilum]|uniref:Uncharacterized protein n=3 Tax=Anaplasma phagocytophilum TaxID=948 RepID=A0A161I6P0_ANAPH|nr:hypothetical protein [Anaplasma phagocytophilum]ANC34733.1 hypothetical protein P029_05625 [Anaplasma phagocytophilum str. Norway variant2]KJV67838.1 hypothetical protein APHNP_0997 [Anaplasma phagocytophilum str. ApNP]
MLPDENIVALMPLFSVYMYCAIWLLRLPCKMVISLFFIHTEQGVCDWPLWELSHRNIDVGAGIAGSFYPSSKSY